MFLTLCPTATHEFQPIIGLADFPQLELVMLLVPLAMEEDSLTEAISSNCCQ